MAEAVGAHDGWSVGEVAARSGVTVRALHHYDHLGLVRPSRDAGGRRSYGAADLARLYRVAVLRRLGLPLPDIADVLDSPGGSLTSTVAAHLEASRHRALAATRLAERVAALAENLDRHGEPDPHELLTTLEDVMSTDPTPLATTTLLIYDDLQAAHTHHVQVLGFTPGPIERGPSGEVVHAEVRAGEHVIWMHPAGDGFASPRTTGAATGMTVIAVDDVDAHCARVRAAGGDIIEEPVDQAYGVREYGVRDPEGQLWFFHCALV